MTTLVHNGAAEKIAAINAWDEGYKALVTETILRPSKRAATGAEVALFAEVCQRTGLDPFAKEIYGIYRWDSRLGREVMTIQVGIDGLRSTAETAGRYDGQTPQQWCGPDGVWVDVWLSSSPPAAARVGVYRKGVTHPTYAVALYREYVQKTKQGAPTGKWADMPANQLSKCAEALALRKANPRLLSGLFIPEEQAAIERTPVEGTAEANAALDAAPVVDAEPVADPVVEDAEPPEAAPADDPLVQQAKALVDRKAITARKLVNQLVASGAQDGSSVSAAIASHPDRDQVAHLLADLDAAEVPA